MKIHEYQAKAILKSFDVPVLRGKVAFSVQEAETAAQDLGGKVWGVKAQIHAGGRGKAGGVKIAHGLEDVRNYANELLGKVLVTKQTGVQGKKVERLYIEEGAEIVAEFYCALLVDRVTQTICLMASSAGGMDIEDVAKERPDSIHKLFVDPLVGITDEAALALAKVLGLDDGLTRKGADFFKCLYNAFIGIDASLIEINPMAVLKTGEIVALDAKVIFDDNALFRHPNYELLRDFSEEDSYERRAHDAGLSYIALDGGIGCMVNGAGLAMATMDTIKLYGAEPANFLDVGGGATTEKVTAAFEIMLSNPNVKAILINIFGGIMRCDTIAEGVVEACHTVKLNVPLVVRMLGTNEEIGRKILVDSGLPIVSAHSMAEAAQKVVALSRGEKI